MPRLRLASLVLLALLGPVAVAAAPAKPQLVAAGATVKEDESGAIVEVRFAGPAVDLGAEEKYFPSCYACYKEQHAVARVQQAA